jgi:hypothetical protein
LRDQHKHENHTNPAQRAKTIHASPYRQAESVTKKRL